MRRKRKACSRRLIEGLPLCGGFVVNVTWRLPPVLKHFVADDQEVDGDIERAYKAIQADDLRESVGGFLFYDHDIEITMRSRIAPSPGTEEDDALGMGRLH